MRTAQPPARDTDTDGQGEIPPLRRVEPAQRPGRILWGYAKTAKKAFRAQCRRSGRSGTRFTDGPCAIGNSRLAARSCPAATGGMSPYWLEREKVGLRPPPPHFLKATAVECIDAYPKDHAKCYIDGSATEGVCDGGYGVYIEWNDNSTTSVSGPVGKRTCSFECEKAAFAECVRLLKERQSKDDQFPGSVIFCDCRSLVQNLGGFNPNNMGNILSVTEQLRQASVRITCQWIPSHVGIHCNEMADELANGGRLKPQHVVPVTLAHVASLLCGGTVKRWEETIRSCDDTRLVKLYEAQRAGDYCTHLSRGDAVQVFRMRVNHTMLLANLSKRGWSPSASCRL